MIIVIIIFLFGGYFFIYTFIETSFNKKSTNGKRTNKTDIAGYWVRLIIVFLFTFFDEGNQWPLINFFFIFFIFFAFTILFKRITRL